MTDDPETNPEPGMCQHPVREYPWADHPRADLRDRAWLRIRETAGYGLKFSKLVIELHGPEAIEKSNYDYQHLRAFIRDLKRAGYVRIERIGPQERELDRPLWVSPIITRDEGVLDTASGTSGHPESSGTELESGSTATANAAGLMRRRRTLETAVEWGDVVGAFAAKRKGEEAGEMLPTRFNALDRAISGIERVETAFAGARGLDFKEGLVLTATTDPNRFESIHAATQELLADVKALRRKVGYPPGVTVVEPTQRGVGHAHVALFNVYSEELPSCHELHRFWWETRERGQQVDLQPIAGDAESWAWANQASIEPAGCPPERYLKEGPAAIVQAAGLECSDLHAVAAAYRERGDERIDANTATDVDAAVRAETSVPAGRVRRAAWYFATGLKATTRPSRTLREAARAGGDGVA